VTRAEYLEFVQEGLAFPESGVGSPDPSRILYDTDEVILRLRLAHQAYCNEVARILGHGDQVVYTIAAVCNGQPCEIVVPDMEEPRLNG
jgi:hypothetical protein